MEEQASILYKSCDLYEELKGILHLQRLNHSNSLLQEEREAEGFLTCLHTIEILSKWNAVAPHIIAVQDGSVVGYLLTMISDASQDMPILRPMFQLFQKLEYQGKPISNYDYIIVGQVCVAKELRGSNVLKNLYHLYENQYKEKFDFAITEISTKNKRSIRAHLKHGFEKLLIHEVTEGEEWCIVILDWNKKNRIV